MSLLISAPASPSPAHASRPSRIPPASGHELYLPIVARPREPIGFVTTPAELAATKALADQGFAPSRSAVITLMRTANEGLAFTPCAVAYYTTDTGSDCLNQSAQYAFVLAMAYRMTYDSRYATQAAAIIRAWYTTLAAIDPDSQTRLDWSRWTPSLTWAADLLDGTPAWTDDDRQQFTAMLVNKLLAIGKDAAARTNNWADAGNLLWLTIAIYAKLPDERAAAIANWKLKLDGVPQPDATWAYGMAPDGSLSEENRRGASGLAYNQGALSYKTVFAEIMRRQGDGSLYIYTTPRGVGLKNGWDFLAQQVVNAHAGVCAWPYTPDHCVNYSNKTGWEIAYARWHALAYLGPILLERPYQWSDASDPSYSTLLFANLDLSGD